MDDALGDRLGHRLAPILPGHGVVLVVLPDTTGGSQHRNVDRHHLDAGRPGVERRLDALPQIYQEVTGRVLDWERNDVSRPGALELAVRNIERHGLEDRVRALRADVYDGLDGERYDLIVATMV